MKLKLVMIWHLYQPSIGMELGWAQENAWECYSQIPAIYRRYPQLKAGINIQGVLIRQLTEFNPEIIADFAELVNKGQFELLTSAFYHPLLPLWPEADVKGQIELNTELLEKEFGVRPQGIWLPELAWSPLLLKPLAEMGLKWTVADSVTWFEARRHQVGEVNEDNRELIRQMLISINYGETERPKALYQPSLMKIGNYSLSFLQREHQLSRFLSDPDGVLTGAVKPKKLLAQLRAISNLTGGKGVVVLAADGEKIGGRGESENLRNFEILLEALNEADFLEVISPGEALASYNHKQSIFLPSGTQHGGFDQWLSLPEDMLFFNRVKQLRDEWAVLAQRTTRGLEREINELKLMIWELQSSTWNSWHFEPSILRIKGYEALWKAENRLQCLEEKLK